LTDVTHRATIVKLVGAPVWVRDTRECRAAILVCIPHEAAAGAKSIAHLSHPVHGDLGGIELLAKLQQIAFIGTHNKTRRQMDWWKTDAPDEKLRAPKVDAGIPLLKSREAVDKILELVLAALGTLGITHTWTKTKEHDPANNNHTSPADQAAPSIGALLELLRGMPNPASASRVGIYLSVMHGAAGCVRAARTLTPKITKAEEVEVAHEAASWAARWESGNSASYQFERDKFNDDFLKSGTVFSGWRTLLLAATELGFTDASYIDAAEEFEAVHMTIAEERRLALRARLAKTVLPNGPRGRPPSVEFLKYDKNTKSPKQLWLIEGLMTEGCMAMMYGKYKAGKTFISLRGNDDETNHPLKFRLRNHRRMSRGHAESNCGRSFCGEHRSGRPSKANCRAAPRGGQSRGVRAPPPADVHRAGEAQHS
jgi:hypothetical protein